VHGICTSDDLDLDEQIVDKSAVRKALTTWFSDWANVRQMHSKYLPPAGKGVQLEERPDGFWLRTRVVEPTAVKLVDEGVYQAYSIGIAKYRLRSDPKAPKGRVLPEVISEVSLVDSPALPKARFTLAKLASDGSIEEVAELAEVAEVGKAVDGERARMHAPFEGSHDHAHPAPPEADEDTHSHEHSHADDNAHDHQHASKLAKVAGVEVCKCSQDCQACQQAICDTCEMLGHGKNATVDLGKRDFDPDVGGGVDRDEIPAEDFAGADRSFPIVTPQDVADAARSLGRTDQDRDKVRRRIITIARRKGPEFEAKLPEEWTDGGEGKAATATVAKDAGPGAGLQALHDAACPQVEVDPDGLSKLLDPSPLAQHLSALLVQDGGSGRNADPIAKLSAVYGQATLLWASDPQVLADARDELAKMQAPHAQPMSKPQGEQTPDPGQFQRGALRGGHQTEPGRETPPRVPGANPARAEEFRRGALESGHQAPTPAEKAGRTFYTRQAAQQARQAMQTLHDHIAAMYPDLCPVTTQERMEEPLIDSMPTGDDQTPTPKAASADPELTKAIQAELDKARDAEVTKVLGGMLPGLVKTAVADALATHRTAVDAEVGELRKMVEQLASEPDPAKAPMRGTAVVVSERRSATEDAQQRARQADADERRAYFERLAKSPVPAIRMAAEQQLTKLAD
jgi:hypothetical protein